MASTGSTPPDRRHGGARGRRVDPRPGRTRAALVDAGQRLLADGRGGLSVAEITTAAGVGLGSFYNHFGSKNELFAAAVTEATQVHGDRTRSLSETVQDPLEVFCIGLRLSGRWQRSYPQLARVLLNTGMAQLLAHPGGLMAHARRDLILAADAGRLVVDDIDAALDFAAGSLIALFARLDAKPEADADALADTYACYVLRGLGTSGVAARRLIARALPEPPAPSRPDRTAVTVPHPSP